MKGILSAVEEVGLAATLRNLRLRAGFTQAELSDASRVSRRSIIRWESGSVAPWIPELKAVLSSLGVPKGEETLLIAIAKGQRQPPADVRYCAMTLGAVLRAIRLRNGLTVRDISERMACDPSTISRWESAKLRLSPVDMGRLWEALGVRAFEVEAFMCLQPHHRGLSLAEAEIVLEQIAWPWDELSCALFDVRHISLIAALTELSKSDSSYASLLAQAQCTYAEFLCDGGRYDEAVELAEKVWAAGRTAIASTLDVEHASALILARCHRLRGGQNGYRRSRKVLDSLEKRPLNLDRFAERLSCYAELFSAQELHKRAVATAVQAVDVVRDKRPKSFRNASVVLARVLLESGDPQEALDAVPPVGDGSPKTIARESLLWYDILSAAGRVEDAAHWKAVAQSTIEKYNLQLMFPTDKCPCSV